MQSYRNNDNILSKFRQEGVDKLIKELRQKLGMTQTELARKAGIKQGVLSYIESGKTKNPRIDTMQAIAAALGVPVERLMKKAG